MAIDLFSGGGGYDVAGIALFGRATIASSTAISLDHAQTQTTITAATGVWQTVLDVSGAGMLRAATAYGTGIPISDYIEMRITIDGTVYQKQVVSSSAASKGVVSTSLLVDSSGVNLTVVPVQHRFKSSLIIEARKSTATLVVAHSYGLDRG